MIYYTVKIFTTVALVIAVSELAKRNTLASAIFASIPLVSVLAMSWLYFETKDIQQVSDLANNVFWLVLPSLTLFLIFPLLVKLNIPFTVSMLISIGVTVLSYLVMLIFLKYAGIVLK